MMALHVCVYSTSCFFCCVFALSFLVTTLVCLPDPYPNQIESLLDFKTEFDLLCNNSVTNSWTNDAISFDGVSFDEETGAVTELKLRGACLYGTLDANSSLFSLNQLRYLDLSYNNFFSSFPAEFGRLTNLEFLDLHENGFTGEVSSSISNLSRLTYLDLKHNNFTSSFPHVYNLTKLSFLDLSDNRYEGKVPEWLWNLPSLIVMSLSYNSLDSFEGSPEAPLNSLTLLNLGHNNLRRLPDIFSNSSLKMLDVGHNQIVGKLPSSLANCTSIEILNMENNGITDTFPFWLKDLPKLQVLVLRSNRFHGPIYSPQHHPLSFPGLRIIDISHNKFDGSLPPNYFVNWSALFESERENDGPRARYRFVDFSENRLGGQIPESIGLLKSLIVLNLSNNNFTGHIPSSLAKLTNLESLDLSRNQLSGNIPQELGELSFLAYMNMSDNKLMGQIPHGTQIAAQSESSFEGNINLCGPPLQKSCSERNGAPSAQTQQIKTPKQEHELNSKAPTIGDGPTLILMIFILGIGHVVIASYSFFAF